LEKNLGDKMVQRALGSMDDAFWLAEEWMKEGGEAVGKAIGMTHKQIKRKNTLLKTLRVLESKAHATHSPLARDIRFLHHFKKQDVLDTKQQKLRKILKGFPKGR
jgi:hypothetical protein